MILKMTEEVLIVVLGPATKKATTTGGLDVTS